MSPKVSDEVRSPDTHPDAQAFLDRLFHSKSERWRSDRFFALNRFVRGGENMDDGDAFLCTLVGILSARDVPFMIVGSTASSWVGDPRSTQDIDVVVDPFNADQLTHVVSDAIAVHWYANEDAARDAYARRSMFNMIQPETGWKADLILRPDDEFDRTAFARRFWHGTRIGPCPIPTVEDQILSKLRWAKMGGSERQLRDCAGILRKWHSKLDREYLRSWADRLGVSGDLTRLLNEIDGCNRP